MKINNLVITTIFLALAGLTACSQEAATTSGALATTPSPIAAKYEGKIVRQPPANRGKDDGWYLVRSGQRQWITDGAWLAKNGYSADAVMEITATEFLAIPENPAPLQ